MGSMFGAAVSGYLGAREELRYREWLRQIQESSPLERAKLEVKLTATEADLAAELSKIQRRRDTDAAIALRVREENENEVLLALIAGDYRLATARIRAYPQLANAMMDYEQEMLKYNNVPIETSDLIQRRITLAAPDITGNDANRRAAALREISALVEGQVKLNDRQRDVLRGTTRNQIHSIVNTANQSVGVNSAWRIASKVVEDYDKFSGGKPFAEPFSARDMGDLLDESRKRTGQFGVSIERPEYVQGGDTSISYRGPVSGVPPAAAAGAAAGAPPVAAGAPPAAAPTGGMRVARQVEATISPDATSDDIRALANSAQSPAEAMIYNQMAELRKQKERLRERTVRRPQSWDAQLRNFFGSSKRQVLSKGLKELYGSGDQARIDRFEAALGQMYPEPYRRIQERRAQADYIPSSRTAELRETYPGQLRAGVSGSQAVTISDLRKGREVLGRRLSRARELPEGPGRQKVLVDTIADLERLERAATAFPNLSKRLRKDIALVEGSLLPSEAPSVEQAIVPPEPMTLESVHPSPGTGTLGPPPGTPNVHPSPGTGTLGPPPGTGTQSTTLPADLIPSSGADPRVAQARELIGQKLYAARQLPEGPERQGAVSDVVGLLEKLKRAAEVSGVGSDDRLQRDIGKVKGLQPPPSAEAEGPTPDQTQKQEKFREDWAAEAGRDWPAAEAEGPTPDQTQKQEKFREDWAAEASRVWPKKPSYGHTRDAVRVVMYKDGNTLVLQPTIDGSDHMSTLLAEFKNARVIETPESARKQAKIIGLALTTNKDKRFEGIKMTANGLDADVDDVDDEALLGLAVAAADPAAQTKADAQKDRTQISLDTSPTSSTP